MKESGFTKKPESGMNHANTNQLENTLEKLLSENNIPKSVLLLNHDQIVPDPDQPRKYYDDSKIKELSYSIKEHGQAQPIKVKELPDGKYQIIVGERRWRAAQQGDFKLEAVLDNNLTVTNTKIIQILENVKREDMSIEDTAIAYVDTVNLIVQESGGTKIEAANSFGLSKSEYYRWESIYSGLTDSDSNLKVLLNYTDDITALDQARKLEKKNPTAFSKLIKKVQGNSFNGNFREEVKRLSEAVKTGQAPKKPKEELAFEGAERIDDKLLLTFKKGKVKESVFLSAGQLSMLNGLFENE